VFDRPDDTPIEENEEIWLVNESALLYVVIDRAWAGLALAALSVDGLDVTPAALADFCLRPENRGRHSRSIFLDPAAIRRCGGSGNLAGARHRIPKVARHFSLHDSLQQGRWRDGAFTGRPRHRCPKTRGPASGATRIVCCSRTRVSESVGAQPLVTLFFRVERFRSKGFDPARPLLSCAR
jgi:hypothetical protein